MSAAVVDAATSVAVVTAADGTDAAEAAAESSVGETPDWLRALVAWARTHAVATAVVAEQLQQEPSAELRWSISAAVAVASRVEGTRAQAERAATPLLLHALDTVAAIEVGLAVAAALVSS